MITDRVTTILQLSNLVQKFISDRDWSKYHNPKDLAISVAIEASELMEIFQQVKENELDKMTENPKKLVDLKEELADIIIYCLSLANALNIDVSRAVTEKISKNNDWYHSLIFKNHWQAQKNQCNIEKTQIESFKAINSAGPKISQNSKRQKSEKLFFIWEKLFVIQNAKKSKNGDQGRKMNHIHSIGMTDW